MSFLLDTCVISELIKKDSNQKVLDWISKVQLDELYISVITIGEIWKGIQKISQSDRKNLLISWFKDDVINFYSNKTITIDINIVMIWGDLFAILEKSGKKMPVLDLLIAATAINNDLILVTRNTKDFVNSGCKLFNPWEQ